MRKVNQNKQTKITKPEKRVDLLPPGLIKITKMALESIKNGGIPSVIIDNCLKIARAKEWPENLVLTVISSPTDDNDKKLILSIMDNLRRPNMEAEKIIIDSLRPLWVSKPKKVLIDEKKPVKNFNKPTINKGVKKTTKPKVVPTVIIKKHRKISEI